MRPKDYSRGIFTFPVGLSDAAGNQAGVRQETKESDHVSVIVTVGVRKTQQKDFENFQR